MSMLTYLMMEVRQPELLGVILPYALCVEVQHCNILTTSQRPVRVVSTTAGSAGPI